MEEKNIHNSIKQKGLNSYNYTIFLHLTLVNKSLKKAVMSPTPSTLQRTTQ